MLKSISRQLFHPDLLWIGGLLIVTALLNLVMDTASPLRPILAALFFLFCPGMALVRLLHLKNLVLEITLGVALSIALTMITSELLVYGQNWDAMLGLRGLSILVITACLIQVVQHIRPESKS